MTHNKINNKPTKQKSNLNNKLKIKIIKINKIAKIPKILIKLKKINFQLKINKVMAKKINKFNTFQKRVTLLSNLLKKILKICKLVQI
jgi:hypothetical protein